jgi:glycosyltransferase involved in cell wall biosynthesis
MSFGVLSTYPSTQCGIATFSQALVGHLQGSGARVGVVRVVDEPLADTSPVVHQLVTGRPGFARDAARVLNQHDVALIQHEYGIFGGPDGSDVLEVMSRVNVPAIGVLHTVLTRPTRNQHVVLARLVDSLSAVVTMTETARARLISGWGVDPAKVTVITHGAEDNRGDGRERAAGTRPTILTWGLLGHGKGIEWALHAMKGLSDLTPRPLYRVVGETHPRVVEREGEAYRERLTAMTRWLGITDLVEFDGRYLAGPDLRAVVREADIVLLPYDSRDQVTSGVLTEAVAAGKPVVSTTFPHAVELLSDGAGLLVPQRSSDAIQHALRRLLTEPELARSMSARSRELSSSLLWPNVANRYIALGRSLTTAGSLSVA